MPLPREGRPADEILEELRAARGGDMPTRGGVSWQYAYDSGRDSVPEMASAAYAAASEVNALDPTTFPSVVKLENEVVGAVSGLLGGGSDAVGTFTSGGTESIMLALKAARDARPEVSRPAIVKPTTGHGAFHKAAHYLGLEVINVPVDGDTFRADPEAMAAAIDERTVLVVASAVSYAHGVLDPVPKIAAAAAARGVLCHVDACVGGFLLPFLDEPVEPFDLSVEGVTSISADVHKYGYAPKGASVVLFADDELRSRSYYCASEWTGYAVINTTVQSSRSAGPLAAAWAVLQHLGEEGYREIVADARAATRRIVEAVREIDGVRVLGDPIATLGTMASDDDAVDVFVVADELRARGEYLLPQLSYGNSPANLHFSTFGVSPRRVEELVAALGESVAAARARGPATPPADLIELLDALDSADLDADTFNGLLARMPIEDGPTPRFAPINAALDHVAPPLREALLARYLGALYRPSSPLPDDAGVGLAAQ